MQTSPVIIPCTAPMTELLRYTAMSSDSHTRRLVAVHTCVFSTASDVIWFAASGEPPLKPVQPIHKKPAPPNMLMMLLGGKCCLSCECLGPTYNQIHV